MAKKKKKLLSAEEELERKRLAALRLFMIPSCENVEYTLDKILGVLSDKEYQEDMRKAVEFSYSTTYETLQRLLTLGRKVACWDEEKLDCLIKDSIPDFMRVGLDYTLRNTELYKVYSSKVLDVLERTAKKCETKEKSKSSIPTVAKTRP